MGHFLTFEGPEGGGKSTHIGLLAERLRQQGYEVVITREPGGTPLCEAIRDLLQYDAAGETPVPRAEALLFCASRAQLVAKVIEPALQRGAWVLADRFADSTLAYQGYGRGFDLDELRQLSRFATTTLEPALTLLLDVPPESAQQRLKARLQPGERSDRFEQESAAFHARLRQGFIELAAQEPERFCRVATDQPLERVAATIWRAVCHRFKLTAEGEA